MLLWCICVGGGWDIEKTASPCLTLKYLFEIQNTCKW